MSSTLLSAAPGNVANNANATLNSKLQQNAYNADAAPTATETATTATATAASTE